MNIFVAKLNPKTTAESLKDLFSNFGEVSSSKLIMDKITGFSKRYGFVEMPNEEEAREAIAKLNDSTFENSVIVVKESLPKEEYSKTKNTNDNSN